MKNKVLTIISMMIALTFSLFASEITFGGGYTKVSLQDGNHTVVLTGNAYANTEDIKLSADSIELYGDNYDMVKCTGSVKVVETEKGISLSCPKLVYNRTNEELLADGWIEIDDTEHEVKLSCAWLDYDKKSSVMLLQISAKIIKDTDSGLMTCTANSIEYNADAQTLTLKGNAKVDWGEDNYSASIITVDLNTEDVTLHGFITGEVNG